MVHAKLHHFPPPQFLGRSLHSDPAGKASEPMRKPRPAYRPQAVCYAHETPTQAAETRTPCGSKQVPLCNMAQATFSSRSATERRARA